MTIAPADGLIGMTWGADGIVFGRGGGGIARVSADGGDPEVLVSVKNGELADCPQLLPDGQHILFTLATTNFADRWDTSQIVVYSLRSGERKVVVERGSDARYLPTGHLVYVVGRTLLVVPFDLQRLEVTGTPVPMVEGVRRGATGSAQFAVSNSGSLLYIPGPGSSTVSPQLDIALIDRKGGVLPLNLPAGPYQYPRVSPDGGRIAFGTDNGKEAIVWIYDLSGCLAQARCDALRLTEEIAFPSGRRMASGSRFSRIANATSPSSGSLPTVLVRRSV